MRNAKLIIVVPMIIIAAAVVVVVAISPPRGTVRYHLERLGSLRQQQPWSGPSSFGDYFRPRTWAWYLRGRLSVSDRVAAMEEHQNALIRLGYFERREFTLRHRRLGAEFWSEFRPAVSNATLADWRWFLHIDNSRPTWLRLTACRADLPTFEQIITQIDKAGSQ